MELAVQCMGPSRDVFGGRVVHVTVDDGATVRALIAQLSARGADAADLLTHCAVAVGDEIVGADHVLRAGDDVALLPPVAGGC